MTTMEPWLREILRCPSCGGSLRDITGPDGGPELQCTGCPLAYRVDDGIPVLLIDEARNRDTVPDVPSVDPVQTPVTGDAPSQEPAGEQR